MEVYPPSVQCKRRTRVGFPGRAGSYSGSGPTAGVVRQGLPIEIFEGLESDEDEAALEGLRRDDAGSGIIEDRAKKPD